MIPLNSRVKRFESNETFVPGPGMYDAQSSLKIREGDRAMASYLSRGNREFIKAVDQPSVGTYNTINYRSLSEK